MGDLGFSLLGHSLDLVIHTCKVPLSAGSRQWATELHGPCLCGNCFSSPSALDEFDGVGAFLRFGLSAGLEHDGMEYKDLCLLSWCSRLMSW